MYHLRRIKSLMLTLLVCTVAHAQIESGKVYNFVNIGNAGKSMTYISENKLSIATTDNTDYKQLWYVEGNANSGYTLRSLANGYYLRSQNSANNTSWTTVKDIDNNCRFRCIAAGNGYTLRATNTTNDQHSMHYGSGTTSIVCWYSTVNASQWTLTEVSLTEEELTANWEYVTSLRSGDIYQTALAALFTDNSCSELKPAYASYTKNQMMSNSYYQQLPSTLQKMVLKMCTDGTWQENNYDNSKDSWSAAYAKKYRVQLYEPYNNISAASKALSLNEHTNMNNPTGIFSGKREAIYVMVQGKIKDGASLYLDSYTGHNKLGTDHKKGIQLHEGLNVIPSEVAGNNYFINYVVETFDISDGKRGHEAKARSLKNYEPLKIHIEGGYINGYYNKVGDALYGSGDKNADWEYIEDRATQTDVTVLGKYMTLQFPLRDEDTEQYEDEKDGNKVKWHKGLGSYLNELVKIEDVINSWDNVMMWERLLLGVLDENTVNAEAKQSPYSITGSKQVIEYTGNDQEFPTGYGDYYNIHGLAYGVGGSAYMYGSGDHSGYHYNTMGGIIQNMPTNAGSHWGPAHEIGHQHQNLLKIRKEMEVTNNLFSNVVLWYFGETTSRVNGTEGSLENILNNFNKEDGHYLTNNIWGMTQMYYKLFLYYHVLGHNPKFYPRLFEILRQDPSNGMAGTVDGEEAQLHIYKKMCQAAGEDLTEFFRAHGFLKPLDGFAIDDYGVSTFYMTQAQIDVAIAEVKSWNYKENVAVLFINDATGETIKSHKGDNLELYGETRVCAEVGGYASFEESITNAGDLEFTVSGKTVTVNKGGGVGYAIFNEKGEIIAFSDKKTFTVSDECATALMWGEATVKVVNADNSVVNVENVDEVVSKYTLLGELITEADVELTYLDATNTKVGYYKEGVLTALQTARNEAKVVYDNQDTQSYTAAYAKLYGELYAVTHDEYNRVSLMAGGTYRLKSRNSSNWMSVNGENKVVGEASNESSTSQQWIFEAAGEDDTYYIKNASTSLYIGGAEKSKQVATQAEAKAYKVVSVETGVWTLQCQDSNLQWLNHNGGSVLGWNDGNDHNSQWYITFKSVTQDAQTLHELNTLVQQTKELIDEMAEVTPMQKQTLQTTSSSSPFYLSTNACHNTLNGASDGQGLAGLLDEDAATYFHSDYNGKVSGTHYLQVNLGSVKDLSEYIFYYTTRADGNNCPTTIEVLGSTDGTNFNTLLYTFTGLPIGAGQTWESPMLTEATNYSSLRFMVTATENNKAFFVMSRFGIAKCEATVQSVGEAYTAQGLTEEQLVAAYADIHTISEKKKVGGVTLDELETLYTNLSTKYNKLLTIYNAAENAAFIAKQTKLANLINSTNHLIGQCGSVTPVIGGALTLSTTAGNNVNYLTTGPNATPSAGKLSDLIDTDNTTSFTSNWERQSGNPYLQVQLPDGQELSKFTFTFTARSEGGAPTPSTIVVSGSNDGNNFTPIGTFTKENHGFPAAASGGTWNSPEIAAKEAYKYLRFTVTKSERSTSGAEAPSGYYHFGISHFGIATVSETVVTVLPGSGEVTEELLLETHDVVAAAQATYDMATTEELLQKAIDKLTEQQKKLQDAKDTVKYVDFFISSNVTGGGVVYGEQSCTDKLTAPSTLEAGDLKAMPVDDYVAKSITINGTEISVIYNKEYTVTITGGEGEGRLTFNGDEYANEGTFNALQGSFTAEAFDVKDVEGYEESEVTVDHENGVVSVTYTLDKTALNDLLGETIELIYACNGFVNSAYVTTKLLDEANAVWNNAHATLKNAQTRSEISEAVNALHTTKATLAEAKTNADAEAAERTQLKEKLNTLITQTEDVIASCYDNDELKFVNSEFVTEESISAVRELVTAANAKCAYNGTTATEYSASITALTTAKSELATAIANAEEEAEQRVRLKSELQELVNSTTDLMELCGTVSEVENQEVHEKLPLQVTSSNGAYYLSSNADQNVVGNAPDGAGIAGLLDGYVDTYMHTQWGGTAVADDHHVQVSLGEGKSLTEFTFTYATRWTGNADKTSPAPTVIKVYGSVGGESWSKLATFPESDEDNPLPASGDLGKYWTSARIESDASYKYLRFVVTNSQGPGNNTYGGHCFFAMSEFAITSIYNYTGPIAEVDVNAGSVTEEQLLAAYTENEEAKALIEGVAVSNADLTTAIKDLTDAKDVLQAAYGTKILPVTLSKSHENPVLYTLHLTGRGDNKVLQYEPASGHMFSVVDVVEGGSAKQAFYFMPGDERTQVYVLPYAAGEQVLAADNTGSGAAKVSAKEQGSAQFEQWKFVESTIEGSEVVYYNLQPTTGISSSVYFSHYGGGSNKMGFYTSIDEGSRLTFTPVEIERSAAYHSLNVYYTEAAKVASSEIVGDDEVGYYPKSEAKAYNEAYPVAGATLTKEDATYAEYLDAYKKFFTANEALVINMPEEGKFYRLRSVKRSSEENPEYAYVNPEENRIFHTSSRGISDATTIWSFVEMSNGTYKMTNLHTGTSLANNGWKWYTALSLYDDAEGVNIVSLSTDGQVGFKCDGIMLHADGNGKVVHWETGANDGSAWRIEEVEDMSLVNFALTITQYRHAGLYLNYSVEIPKEGIKVYIAHTSNGTTGEIIADELDGTIIPARTAVIVKGDADTYNFKYTTEGYDGTENLDNNLLGGSAYLKYQQVDQAGNLCCVFGQKGGVVGLYKNWVGYTDANGTVAEDTNSDGKVNEDNGTYFKISANKIYYEYTPFEGNGASAFRFRLNDKEDTTELDTLIMTEDSVIYNLYGQRLKEIIVPGFYIINGKKVYVNEKMINNK